MLFPTLYSAPCRLPREAVHIHGKTFLPQLLRAVSDLRLTIFRLGWGGADIPLYSAKSGSRKKGFCQCLRMGSAVVSELESVKAQKSRIPQQQRQPAPPFSFAWTSWLRKSPVSPESSSSSFQFASNGRD